MIGWFLSAAFGISHRGLSMIAPLMYKITALMIIAHPGEPPQRKTLKMEMKTFASFASLR
jgi:hypothetical protein